MDSLGLKLQKIWRVLEWVLGGLAAANCIWLGLSYWQYQLSSPGVAPQSLWPIPALFLVEIILLGVAGLYSIIINNRAKQKRLGTVPWISAGALSVFVILAGVSFGTGLIPAAGAFTGAGIFADVRQEQSILKHIGLFLLSAFVQALLMFAILIIQA